MPVKPCKPLDTSEFAVRLDNVRSGCAPPDDQRPARFFARTYLTWNPSNLASHVIRRRSGGLMETSTVFNLATQFGVLVDTFLWTLARALSALLAWTTEGTSWVGGVLAHKNGMGF